MWISRDNVRRGLERKTSGVQPAQGFPAACAKGLSWRFGGGRTLAKGHLLHCSGTYGSGCTNSSVAGFLEMCCGLWKKKIWISVPIHGYYQKILQVLTVFEQNPLLPMYLKILLVLRK